MGRSRLFVLRNRNFLAGILIQEQKVWILMIQIIWIFDRQREIFKTGVMQAVISCIKC